MIPRIYPANATEFESNGLGLLKDTIECIVEEERNGLFDLQLIIPVGSFLFAEVKRGNIIKAHASDRLRNQLFRIHDITKPFDGKVKVFANHISFDLAHDFVENIDIQNQSCEYVLNEIFRQSNFCKHFKGYSNILNAQNYKISICNCLEAIAGKRGSIIDSFGNGAEVLRDNYNISVLNSRGNEENVLLAYRKNLTGFELHEDDSSLITRIYPYAKYTEQPVEGEEASGGTNEEITVTLTEKFVDSKRINNYSHPYIVAMDFSEKFGENEIPTEEKLRNLATKYFTDNNCDLPKFNYKIEFIPLSKTEEYKDYKFLENIGMCDKVLIRNSMYDIYDQAKVIKTSYDVLNEKYRSIELGEPKSTLGDIIKTTVDENNSQQKEEIKNEIDKVIEKTKDPDTLPKVPVVTLKTGFSTIEVSWTYENKNYYTFEVYANQTIDFSPNVFDLVFKGQASTFLHEVKPSQTWYYKVRAINSYGRATDFSTQMSGTTTKIANGAEYFESAAIKDALIGELRLDRGWVGQLQGTHIDAKNLTVTDGNGKQTLNIDSFGRVNLDVTNLKILSNEVALKSELDVVAGKVSSKVSSGDVYSIIEQSPSAVKYAFNGISSYVTIDRYGLEVENGRIKTDALIPGSDSRIVLEPNYYWGNGQDRNDIRSIDANNGDIRLKYDRDSYISVTDSAIRFYANSGHSSVVSIDSSGIIGYTKYINESGNYYRIGDWKNSAGLYCQYPGNGIRLKSDCNDSYASLGLNSSQAWLNQGSDIRLKENVHYLKEENLETENKMSTLSLSDDYAKSILYPMDNNKDDNILLYNEETYNNKNISRKDLYDFVKNDLKLCEYNYINNEDINLNFIAQDIVDTKIGSLFVTRDESGYLGFKLNHNYINIAFGALQHEISQREKLENRVNELEKELIIIKEKLGII